MKPVVLALAAAMTACLSSTALAQDAKAPPVAAAPDPLKDPQAQISYALGVSVGMTLRQDSQTVDPAVLAQGVRDALGGGRMLMNEEQVRAALDQLKVKMQAQRAQNAAKAAEANRAAGAAFLKANGAKAGVVTLASGLQYQVLTQGHGPKPKLDETVVCNYRGTLLDGTEFDSSYGRGEPASFPVSGVIKGWTEALQLMPVGSKWKLFVPADLAYGDKGAGGVIGAGATLIFEVELLSITPKAG